MSVDFTGFNKKINALRRMANSALPSFIEDAGVFLLVKLVDEIINGTPGEAYPKNYPSGVSSGAAGFVGVVSGNLRRSIQLEPDGPLAVEIKQTLKDLAPYHDFVINFSKERYGKNFYEITVEIYGPVVAQKLVQVASRLSSQIDSRGEFVYRNPF